MAKLKDLAGLAALGMLGYKLSQGKGSTTDTGDETSRLAARKPAPEPSAGEKAVSDTKSSVLTAIQNPNPPREAGIAAANDVRDSAPATAPKSSPSTAKAKPRVGMTGAQNDALAGAGKQAKMASENNALAKVNRGMGREVTEAAKYNASSAASAVKPTSTASKVLDTAKNAATTVAKTAYSGVPTSEQAAANRQAAYDKVKGIGSSVVDYVKNFETPAERAARERKAASGMKRGGAVKKMAKGGMTSKVSSASSRADGIASRGKTKCKMY